LKANAYGHGAAALSPLYEKWGAEALAFATAEEALDARKAGVKIPIILLGHTDPLFAPDLAAHGIIPTVHSPASARELSFAAKKAGVILPVQVKIDTGMGRIGFVARAGREAACARAVLSAARLLNLRAVGLFTHFSSADDGGVGLAYTKEQLSRFLVVRENLFRAGLSLLSHTANSAAALSLPASHLDMIRPGLALYGIDPREEGAHGPASLSPALTVRAKVAQVRWVGRGEAIGYGRAFLAPRAMRVATLAIGYADGLSRMQADAGGGVEATPPSPLPSLAGEGGPPQRWMRCLRSANKKDGVFLPFVGRISMDQCTVDATAAPFLRAGDTVTVLGGRGPVSFAAAASREGTIPYELLTRLSPRLSILYREGE
jgi:alanine racemase